MSDELVTVADATAAGLSPTPRDSTRLIVYYGDGPEARTRIVELPDGADIGFGRSRGEMVHIDSERVSRRHARLRRRGGEITIEDLGSRNGTWVNGSRIDAEMRLRSGDEIAVGPITAIVTRTTGVTERSRVGDAEYFEERLKAEADRGHRYHRRFALVMLRIEPSGPVDYAHGSPVDEAIERIARDLRPMDVIAEYGPDELALLLPELEQTDLPATVRRLAEAARGEGGELRVRIGGAMFPDHAVQSGELLSRARAALRSARVDGHDIVVSPPEEAAPAGSDIIVNDPQMQRVFALARKVAPTGMTVLVTGETGAGKEVVAEELHRASGRGKRFIRVNCASIAETLLESELFGHERGAFTSADRQKKGYFEVADGGTLFLDEIGEISAGLQAKLLRILEERRFTRVGGTREIEVDVRVVCATNRDLEAEVAKGNFREDLFFRISAFTIVVPPLRDRRGDIRQLSELFIRQAAGGLCAPPTLSPEALTAVQEYAWPGNVRELRNAMERAVVLQSNGIIDPTHLPERMHEQRVVPVQVGVSDVGVRSQVASVEKSAIEAALRACNGNQTRASRRLGLSRRALIYKMEKYGLKRRPGSNS